MAKKPPTSVPLAEIPNPFLQDRVDTPWQESFWDEPEINRTAFSDCLSSMNAVWQTRQSRGLILHGEPGSGKTHLLQRLRFYTRNNPRTCFVYLPPSPSPGRFWRHLLERFFYDVCQRSKIPEGSPKEGSEESRQGAGPGQGPLTQIEEILTRHLVNKPLASTQELARIWADICRQAAPGKALFNRLKPTFDHLAVQYRLDPDVMKVLRHYITWHHRAYAYAYLLGTDLPEEEIKLLEIMQSLDDEDRAQKAVMTFCHLAGTNFTIILAFDQLEGVQVNRDDLDGLHLFARSAVSLLGECSNVLVLSAVQTYFLETLEKAIHRSDYDRLAQDQSVLTLLNGQTAKRLIECRLRTQPQIINFQKNEKHGILWPFTPEEIDEEIQHARGAAIPARILLRWARNRFEEIRGSHLPPPPTPSLSSFWEEQLEEELKQPITRLGEGVYEDGLLKLLQVKSPKGWRSHRGRDRDIHLILEGKEEKVGISVANTENMTSLARYLGRLQAVAQKGKVTRLILLRDARLPISAKASTTRERLKDLEKKGMCTIRPSAEAYAALNVLRRLWNQAAENDLVVGDLAISMGELQGWLAEKTPRPLQELIDTCREVLEGERSDLADRILEILRGQWIMNLDDAAKKWVAPRTI